MIPAARPLIGDDERAAVDAVLQSGMIAQGPQVAAFEEEFAEVVAGRECIAVNSGTSALHLALLAMGVGPGDEVIVPSFTFAATGNAVAITGATPVFVDIEPDYFTIDPSQIEQAITDRTRAIIPVHLYGHPAEMRQIMAIADAAGLQVLEDAAQAHLSALDGRPVGAWGNAAAFSFYPTKNMTAGEGGMIVTNDPELARTARLLRNQGMEKRYHNEIAGLNNRMTDIHAAIGRVQLGKLAGWTEQRQQNAKFLDAHLQGVTVPPRRSGRGSRVPPVHDPSDWRPRYIRRTTCRCRRGVGGLLPGPNPYPANLWAGHRSTSHGHSCGTGDFAPGPSVAQPS
jgi:perosamine synthetase